MRHEVVGPNERGSRQVAFSAAKPALLSRAIPFAPIHVRASWVLPRGCLIGLISPCCVELTIPSAYGATGCFLAGFNNAGFGAFIRWGLVLPVPRGLQLCRLNLVRLVFLLWVCWSRHPIPSPYRNLAAFRSTLPLLPRLSCWGL